MNTKTIQFIFHCILLTGFGLIGYRVSEVLNKDKFNILSNHLIDSAFDKGFRQGQLDTVELFLSRETALAPIIVESGSVVSNLNLVLIGFPDEAIMSGINISAPPHGYGSCYMDGIHWPQTIVSHCVLSYVTEWGYNQEK